MIRRALMLGVLAGAVAVAAPSLALGANGDLWVYGTASTGDTGLQVLGATSPAVTGLTTGGYETAWQGADGVLATAGSNGSGRLGLSMAPGTNPAITDMAGGAWEIAFQGSNGHLWTTGATGVRDWGLGLMSSSSPGPGKLKRFVRQVLGTRYSVGDRLLLTLSAPRYRAERAQIAIRSSRRPRVRLL